MRNAGFLFLMAALSGATGGCLKVTKARHTWPDKSTTEINDWRLNMKSEAQFMFEQDSNGVKRITAGLRSEGEGAEEFGTMMGAAWKAYSGR